MVREKGCENCATNHFFFLNVFILSFTLNIFSSVSNNFKMSGNPVDRSSHKERKPKEKGRNKVVFFFTKEGGGIKEDIITENG